uniref:Uncharacterized protein n=1 Tax=Caenorhabditis tropicalis TaxID=1561998 RepID=A0A1I7UNY8_9PELO
MLFWSYAGLAFIFVCSLSIPLYLQHVSVGDMTTGQAISENYVQWHLEKEIKQIKAETRKRKGKKKRNSLSTEEEL